MFCVDEPSRVVAFCSPRCAERAWFLRTEHMRRAGISKKICSSEERVHGKRRSLLMPSGQRFFLFPSSAAGLCKQAVSADLVTSSCALQDCWVRKKILDKMRHDQQVSASRARRGVFASLASGIFGSKMSADEEQTGKLLEEVNAKVDTLEQQINLR